MRAHRGELGLVAADRAGVGVDREVRLEVGDRLQSVVVVESGKCVDQVDGGPERLFGVTNENHVDS